MVCTDSPEPDKLKYQQFAPADYVFSGSQVLGLGAFLSHTVVMSDGKSPPEDNDLGQNAKPVYQVDLETWAPRAQELPPEQYFVCCTCGFPYKRSLMVKFRSKYYCKPQECYRDIRGIRLQDNPDAQFKNKGFSDSFRGR